MVFNLTPLGGAFTIDLEKRGDNRGFFARMFCEREFGQAGLETQYVQVNDSFSAKRGTLRGMHYQLPPASEVKLVRCIKGAVNDVIVDLRPDSPTFKQWFGAELTADNHRMMYVPRGFGHGFITLTEDTELLYLVSDFYSPENERGIRYNDQIVGIEWPVTPTEISEKDRNWPDLDPQYHGLDRIRGVK